MRRTEKRGKRDASEDDAQALHRRRLLNQEESKAFEAAQRQKEEELKAAAEAEYDDGDENYEDIPSDGEIEVYADEIIEEDDDDEEVEEEEEDEGYADFQNEASAALEAEMKKVSFSEGVPAEPESGQAKVWRNDLDADYDESVPLEYSNKAYDSFFQLRTEYPCLSFDILKDADGANRTKYPLSMYLLCGSQAEEGSRNQLYVLHITNICRTKYDEESDADSDESYIGDEGGSDNDGSEADAEEINNGEPVVNFRAIKHHGTANRVRCSKQCPALAAVWSDAGHVQVFDVGSEMMALGDFARWSKEQAKNWRKPAEKSVALRFCSPSSTHEVEGYGLDWSSVEQNVFASGDCGGSLFVWRPTEDGRWHAASSSRVAGNDGASVEEIKWSPTQSSVLICGRAGGMVEVWDTRDMRRSKLAWQADETDINVADWNHAVAASHLLVTGADSGAVAVWDLRKMNGRQQDSSSIQTLRWHKKSITSVEFNCHNESVLSVTSHDGQCTLWDLSLERDPSEEMEVVGELFGRSDLSNIPDQLMFQHQGLLHVKEAHWHSQIPGMVITTDYNGLHLFRPMNWRSLMK